MIINISPVPKPRMTSSDRWKKRPCCLRYWAFKDQLRERIEQLPCPLTVTFGVPMHKSWSEKTKKENDGKPCLQAPDIDNLLKALLDAIYDEDSMFYEVHAKKVWSRKGFIDIKEA